MTGERIRRGVRDFWEADGGGAATAALAPGEAAFRLAVTARNRWHDRSRPARAEIPVVSVGSLAAGGTGKTPVARWLAAWLRARGVPPAVVTRGYAADEVALHGRWFGAGAVFAGRDRRACVGAAAAAGRRVAVLDDGFQHRRLARDVDVLLVAAEDPPAVRLHPRGPYREPLSSARRASHVLVTRRTAPRERAEAWRRRMEEAAPGVPVARAELALGRWRDLAGAPAASPRGDVLAVCAVGRPRSFAAGLEAALPGSRVELAAYADHHDYRRRDVARLLARRGGRALVCTEKDAVKLVAFPELAECAVVAGFGVAGRPRGELRRALEAVARRAAAQ